MNETTALWLTSGLFIITYLGLAIGRVPGLRIDRAGIAWVGAAAMLCTGMITLGDATAPNSIDYPTLFLQFGMMVVVGFLRVSGMFARLAHGSLDRIRSPRGLLAMVVVLAGVLSAFLVNDIVCLALTPLILQLTRKLGYKPLPHMIALATASNIGSSATITGNPQNIFIGAHSHISYFTFAIHLMPVAMIGLIIDYVIISVLFRGALAGGGAERTQAADVGNSPRRHGRAHLCLQYKSMAVAVVAVALFFTGLPIALVAVGAASVMLISRIRPGRIYRQIDWSLLLMFVGLFIVVHAFQANVMSRWDLSHWGVILSHPVDVLSPVSALLSNVVSNVPAVLLLAPIIHGISSAGQQSAWLALAMSSTLAGNFTILGSIANLIVVETARAQGVEVSFWDYCKAGVPITLCTLSVGIAWLRYVHY